MAMEESEKELELHKLLDILKHTECGIDQSYMVQKINIDISANETV